ncbi:unnamed protein product, partial [Amoebophrya sp. A120]|eukprot:GSA120T00021520001.1
MSGNEEEENGQAAGRADSLVRMSDVAQADRELLDEDVDQQHGSRTSYLKPESATSAATRHSLQDGKEEPEAELRGGAHQSKISSINHEEVVTRELQEADRSTDAALRQTSPEHSPASALGGAPRPRTEDHLLVADEGFQLLTGYAQLLKLYSQAAYVMHTRTTTARGDGNRNGVQREHENEIKTSNRSTSSFIADESAAPAAFTAREEEKLSALFNTLAVAQARIQDPLRKLLQRFVAQQHSSGAGATVRTTQLVTTAAQHGSSAGTATHDQQTRNLQEQLAADNGFVQRIADLVFARQRVELHQTGRQQHDAKPKTSGEDKGSDAIRLELELVDPSRNKTATTTTTTTAKAADEDENNIKSSSFLDAAAREHVARLERMVQEFQLELNQRRSEFFSLQRLDPSDSSPAEPPMFSLDLTADRGDRSVLQRPGGGSTTQGACGASTRGQLQESTSRGGKEQDQDDDEDDLDVQQLPRPLEILARRPVEDLGTSGSTTVVDLSRFQRALPQPRALSVRERRQNFIGAGDSKTPDSWSSPTTVESVARPVLAARGETLELGDKNKVENVQLHQALDHALHEQAGARRGPRPGKSFTRSKSEPRSVGGTTSEAALGAVGSVDVDVVVPGRKYFTESSAMGRILAGKFDFEEGLVSVSRDGGIQQEQSKEDKPAARRGVEEHPPASPSYHRRLKRVQERHSSLLELLSADGRSPALDFFYVAPAMDVIDQVRQAAEAGRELRLAAERGAPARRPGRDSEYEFGYTVEQEKAKA